MTAHDLFTVAIAFVVAVILLAMTSVPFLLDLADRAAA